MLINGPDLGGIFLEYPSNVGRNANNAVNKRQREQQLSICKNRNCVRMGAEQTREKQLTIRTAEELQMQ